MRVGRCFICGKSVKQKEVVIKISPTLWRHEGCRVGSPRWMASARAAISEFRKLFTEKGE